MPALLFEFWAQLTGAPPSGHSPSIYHEQTDSKGIFWPPDLCVLQTYCTLVLIVKFLDPNKLLH